MMSDIAKPKAFLPLERDKLKWHNMNSGILGNVHAQVDYIMPHEVNDKLSSLDTSYHLILL